MLAFDWKNTVLYITLNICIHLSRHVLTQKLDYNIYLKFQDEINKIHWWPFHWPWSGDLIILPSKILMLNIDTSRISQLTRFLCLCQPFLCLLTSLFSLCQLEKKLRQNEDSAGVLHLWATFNNYYCADSKSFFMIEFCWSAHQQPVPF